MSKPKHQKLTKDEQKTLFRLVKKLLAPRVSEHQGRLSAQLLSQEFRDCKTAQTVIADHVVHFATRDYLLGHGSRSGFDFLPSREFDRSVDRRRVTYNHVLIYTQTKRGKKSKKFVGLEAHGQLDMNCHSHKSCRELLEALRAA